MSECMSLVDRLYAFSLIQPFAFSARWMIINNMLDLITRSDFTIENSATACSGKKGRLYRSNRSG